MKSNMRRSIAVAGILCAAVPGLSATQVIHGITCGGTRCPEPLELTNGEAVTVTLSGERLDELISGMVSFGAFRPAQIPEVSVELVAMQRLSAISRRAMTRNVTLTARGAEARSGLDLRFATRDGRSVRAPLQVAIVSDPVVIAIPQPVVTVAADQVTRVHHDNVFRRAFDDIFEGTQSLFGSCGSPALHRFAISVPRAGYSASGEVPRFEHIVIPLVSPEWQAFLEDHTLDPSDIFTGELAEVGNSAHPSPIPHSISAVRMCLMPEAAQVWTSMRGDTRGGVPQLIVTVAFDRLWFRARGMPADAVTGAPASTTAGIRWGWDVTDNELPDFGLGSPRYEILLPLEVSGGRITYGTPRRGANTTSSEAWSGQFLGPGTVRQAMETYARDRAEQIGQELLKVFAAAGTRHALSNRIAGWLGPYGITEVVGIAFSPDNTWEVTHR